MQTLFCRGESVEWKKLKAKKASAHIKRGNYNKILFIQNKSLQKSQQKKKDWIFLIKHKKLNFEKILILEGLSYP